MADLKGTGIKGGGGGGSFNLGSSQTNNSGIQTGNAQVSLSW